MEDNVAISCDKSKLDLDMIYRFLVNDSYWARGRTWETFKKSVDNSLCFGVFEGSKQIGFARVVTDYAVFAWIMDVFILKEYRHRGFGKILVKAIVDHPDLKNLKRWGLSTNDAHGLYKKFDFRVIREPDMFMERLSHPS